MPALAMHEANRRATGAMAGFGWLAAAATPTLAVDIGG
jgi:hypothetical protein